MHLSTAGWAIGGLSIALVAAVAPDAPRLVADVTGPSFPDAVVAVASLLALALGCWSLLAAVLILVAGSSRLVATITPAVMRRALLAGAAGALAIGPAHAGTIDSAPHHTVDGLRLPDRPDAVESVHHVTPTAAVVTVRPGDSLWSIAARMLPADATEAEIAHATRQWHEANRDVIGDDPNRIFPAQHLTPPTGKDQP